MFVFRRAASESRSWTVSAVYCRRCRVRRVFYTKDVSCVIFCAQMETFIIIGVCFLCYELCELLYQCTPRKKQESNVSTDCHHVIYTIPEPEQKCWKCLKHAFHEFYTSRGWVGLTCFFFFCRTYDYLASFTDDRPSGNLSGKKIAFWCFHPTRKHPRYVGLLIGCDRRELRLDCKWLVYISRLYTSFFFTLDAFK